VAVVAEGAANAAGAAGAIPARLYPEVAGSGAIDATAGAIDAVAGTIPDRAERWGCSVDGAEAPAGPSMSEVPIKGICERATEQLSGAVIPVDVAGADVHTGSVADAGSRAMAIHLCT